MPAQSSRRMTSGGLRPVLVKTQHTPRAHGRRAKDSFETGSNETGSNETGANDNGSTKTDSNEIHSNETGFNEARSTRLAPKERFQGDTQPEHNTHPNDYRPIGFPRKSLKGPITQQIPHPHGR